MADKTVCPHCQQDVELIELAADYCAKRWNRPDLDEHGRVQCPLCKATFRKNVVAGK